MKLLRLFLYVVLSLMLCSCSNTRIKEYSEKERENYIKSSDLIYEGTIDKIVNIGNGDKFKAQAQETYPDHNWLVIFKITKILKGSYQYDELGMTVHSPTLSFGTFIFPSPAKRYRIYLKSQPSEFTDYILVGKEWIK